MAHLTGPPELPGVPIWARQAVYWLALAVAGAALLAKKVDQNTATLVAATIIGALGQGLSLWYTRPKVKAREADALLRTTGRHADGVDDAPGRHRRDD